jgi:hypothetical protein
MLERDLRLAAKLAPRLDDLVAIGGPRDEVTKQRHAEIKAMLSAVLEEPQAAGQDRKPHDAKVAAQEKTAASQAVRSAKR